MNLFSVPSLLTMVHGLVLSGGAIVGLVVSLLALRWFAQPAGVAGAAHAGGGLSAAHADSGLVGARAGDRFAQVTTVTAVLLWLAVLGGTYLVFPLYREAPPEGVTALADYPRAMLMANPDTRWLHAFGMEVKEHVPWIAAMLTTATAFVARRHRHTVLADGRMRRVMASLLVISLALVSFVGLMGVFVNKVAPLD